MGLSLQGNRQTVFAIDDKSSNSSENENFRKHIPATVTSASSQCPQTDCPDVALRIS